MIYLLKSFRSFNAKNYDFVGHRTAKLLAVKIGVLKKKSAASAIPAKVCARSISLGSRTPWVKSFSKFEDGVCPLKVTSF